MTPERRNACALVLLLAITACGHRALPLDDAGIADSAPTAGSDIMAAVDGPAASACVYQVIGGPTGVSPISSEVFTPSLAISGSGFGLVWMRSTADAHPMIRMRLADRKAELVGQEQNVGPDSHSWAELAHDGASFGLCWYSDPAMQGRLAFRRVSDQGAPVGTTTDIGSQDFGEVCNALIGGPQGWAAVVRGGFQAGDGGWAHRYGLVRLDASGQPMNQPANFYPFAKETTRTGLTRTDKGYLVTYRVHGKVLVQAFDAAGTPSGTAHTISLPTEHADSPEVVWTGKRALVVYLLRDDKGLHHVTLRPVDAAGQPQGAALEVTPRGDAWAHSTTWTGAELALSYAWDTGNDHDTDVLPPPQRVYLTRLREDGGRLQSDLEVYITNPGVDLSRTMVRGSPERIGVSWQQQQGSSRQAMLAVAGCGAP